MCLNCYYLIYIQHPSEIGINPERQACLHASFLSKWEGHMSIISLLAQKYRRFFTVLISLSVLLSASTDILYAAPSGSQNQTEADPSGLNDTSSENIPYEERFHENEWNYVEDSMDVSSGIPADALGRLALIRSRGVLRVVTEPYFPPQEFIDPELEGQDRYQGADMSLARLIAERMGVELEIVELGFTEVLSSMKAGKYDLAISGLSYTPERASSMELSKGYHYASEGAHIGLIIHEDNKDDIRELSDLAGRNLIAQQGSLQELLAAQNITGYSQFKRVSSVQEIYDEVSGKEADAAAVDIESAKLYIRNNPDCSLMLMEGIDFQLEEQFEGDRIAGPKDDLELMYFVNGVIDEVLSSGEYEKWFAESSARAAELGL